MAKKGRRRALKSPKDIELSNFEVVELSLERKKAILERTDELPPLLFGKPAIDIDPDLFFANLKKFYPPAEEEFTLRTTQGYPAPFRLLRDKTKGGTNSTQSFIALSYCWHYPSWRRATGYENTSDNKRRWPISTSILKEILALRNSEYEGLWIDSLCINQKDADEKQLAVSSFDTIYSKARLVVIVLEDVLLEESEVSLLQSLNTLDTKGRRKTVTQGTIIAQVMAKICSARWFQRAWCLQESLLSNERAFLVPGIENVVNLCSGLFKDLLDLTWSEASMKSFRDQNKFILSQSDVEKLSDANSTLPEFYRKGAVLESIDSSIEQVHKRACSNLTDKINIFLNIRRLPLSFKGSNLSKTKAGWVTSMIALASGNLDILCATGPYIRESREAVHDPWLMVQPIRMYRYLGHPQPRPTTVARINSLDAKGMSSNVLHVKNLQINAPSEVTIARATKYLGTCQVRCGEIYDQSVQYILSRLQVQFLACAVECGLEWILQQVVPDWMGFKFLVAVDSDALEKYANALFDLFPTQARETSSYERTQVAKFITQTLSFSTVYLRNHWEFLRLLLPSRFEYLFKEPNNSLDSLSCGWIDLGNGQKAITIHSALDILNHPNLRAVVLDSCREPGCALMTRLWIIDGTQFPVSKGWSILTKHLLFTTQPLVANASNLTEIENLRICGWIGSMINTPMKPSKKFKRLKTLLATVEKSGNETNVEVWKTSLEAAQLLISHRQLVREDQYISAPEPFWKNAVNVCLNKIEECESVLGSCARGDNEIESLRNMSSFVIADTFAVRQAGEAKLGC